MLNNCPLCKGERLHTIYEIENMPIFQNKVYDDSISAKNSKTYHLSLSNCEDCGFVFNRYFDSNIMDYDENYQNEQNYSQFFKEYLNEVIEFLKTNFSTNDKVIEIGSGKGYFLELLEKNNFKNIVGFDPAYEGEKQNIKKDYYTSKYKDINADLIILRHTLEHIDSPFEFLKEVAEANDYSGKIFIEVPCFEWIKKKEAFWDIFYEHCNYFTKDTLKSMFKNYDVGELFNRQYIYILADLKDLKKTIKAKNHIKYEKLFTYSLEKYFEYIKNAKSSIWGAGAKGVTFLNILDSNNEFVQNVVDINPKKQNKYIAQTSHKIVDVEYLKKMIIEKKVDTILIMNENYKQEIIKELHGYKLNYITLGENK